ncbi:hypothetical protein PGRAN_04766 [Listeria grandensis FSL F6-0971]|uniref:Uncharacterized protein n=1 Tax=Listeria grandensis FSL F6-0971 TaxID=1265819 RepID=W7B9L9_9LIST|nr:hypothetical protein PGRAN_04766 [Listeria grandensis FSL F6-0971]
MFLIELRVPGLRSFHPLRKNQKRIFTAAAPSSFSPDGRVQHLLSIELRAPNLRNFHTLRKSQKRTFTEGATNSFRSERARLASN